MQFAAKLSKIKSFRKYSLNWSGFAIIRCPFHLPQFGQSENFQLCALITNKQRNRLLDVTLNALVNASINELEQLNHEGELEVARKWTTAKDRQRVTGRARKAVESADGEKETNVDEHELRNEVKIEKLLLQFL